MLLGAGVHFGVCTLLAGLKLVVALAPVEPLSTLSNLVLFVGSRDAETSFSQ